MPTSPQFQFLVLYWIIGVLSGYVAAVRSCRDFPWYDGLS